MLSREENELLTRTGPGTPMGNLMRHYWIPILLAREVETPDGEPVTSADAARSLDRMTVRMHDGSLPVEPA